MNDGSQGVRLVYQAKSPAILESNIRYFIFLGHAEDSRVVVTSSSNEDPGASPRWAIGNRLLKKSGDSWRSVPREDAGRKVFPANASPVLRIGIQGSSLDNRSIIISLTKIGDGQFKATTTANVPSDIVIPITVINGTIDRGATTVTIPAGSTESSVVFVSRTPGTTFPVTIDIGNLPSPPSGYDLFKSTSHRPLEVLEGVSGGLTPVSERTPQVRDAIVAAVPGVNSAADVTEAHLAAITGLSVNHPVGTALSNGPITFKIDDFAGLTALTTLEMEGHAGIILPDGIFDNLTSLERLSLYNTSLTSIPNAVLRLTTLKSLNLGYHYITSIAPGTFDQLTQLKTLVLDDAAYANTFTSLPAGVFDKLTSLTSLNLAGDITSLPAGVFDKLTSLTSLNLAGNDMTSLPAGVFDKLTSLKSLNLNRIYSLSSLPTAVFNRLTSLTSLRMQGLKPTYLPDGIFSGLSSLTFLDLSEGQLTNLPAGIFSGLTTLTSLRLGGNSVDPLPITVSLEKVAEGQFKAVAPTGAPFDIVLPVSVRHGSINDGTNTLTIFKGDTESTTLTITRTTGTTAVVTADIRTLPGLPTDVDQYRSLHHQGYTLEKSNDLPLVVISRIARRTNLVSERTPQVRDAIVAAVPAVNNASDVTEAHLASITELNLNNKGISTLKTGDFEGLTSLQKLRLYRNQLTSLPADIFDGLEALTILQLYDNQLKNLPEDIFDELISLTRLQLGSNQFTTLPSTIFNGLTKLTDLRMIDNQFSSLPDGIFDGLTGLTRLSLQGNTVDPLSISISLEKVGTDQFKAVVPTGTPFEMVLPIRIRNGSVVGVSSITIPAGSVENGPLTVTRYPGTTTAVTADIRTLPRIPSGHSGYTFMKSVTLPLSFTGQLTEFLPISQRTPQVRDLILLLVRARFQQGISANQVTEEHLSSITLLQLFNKSITSLKTGDFSGLPSLEKLNLDNNSLANLPTDVFNGLSKLKELWLQNNALTNLSEDVFNGLSALEKLQLASNSLTSLPENVFDGLTNLTTLELSSNHLTNLPTDVFDGLSALQIIILRQNALTSLPADLFDGLTNLKTLELSYNDLTNLPGDIFDGLTNLKTLRLSNNSLTNLPEGIFEGLSNLTRVSMHSNSAPLLVTISLQKVGEGQFNAVAPTGAPFSIVLPLIVSNGSITGGATTITIPAGGVESQTLTVTRTPTTTDAVTVHIGTLPRRPSGHYDYRLVKSTDLPLEIISIEPTVTAPQTTGIDIPDPNLRANIESALRKKSGEPITGTEMATLTSLIAQDARITNLTGLESATNLTTLKLGNNAISNISTLAGLTNLTELQLWDNQITNLSDLSGLTSLTTLYLWGNIISDISHLSGLINLTRLRLNENSITDISTVANLTNLTQLYLNHNSITDISAVAGLTNLTELVIGDNTISDISFIQNLTNLEWLDMPNNSISDISAVQNLTALVELYFQNNVVSDLSPLVANTGFGEFTEIDVRGNLLNYSSIHTHIPALQAKDVYIDFDNRVSTPPVKISGDTQSGNTETTLTQPFIVEVRDTNSVIFEGVPVTLLSRQVVALSAIQIPQPM